jgi:hypothetical protein
MVQGFAKNLLARRWVDVIGSDITASDAHAASLAALRVASYPRGVDGRDVMWSCSDR